MKHWCLYKVEVEIEQRRNAVEKKKGDDEGMPKLVDAIYKHEVNGCDLSLLLFVQFHFVQGFTVATISVFFLNHTHACPLFCTVPFCPAAVLLHGFHLRCTWNNCYFQGGPSFLFSIRHHYYSTPTSLNPSFCSPPSSTPIHFSGPI